MEWLNLNTAVIDSPEFAMAEPAQIGTWLKLMRYCAGQENGGLIQGAKNWTARQWAGCVRVLPEDVTTSPLWRWLGDDLMIAFYPAEREKLVKTRRAAGSDGGKAKTQAKTQASAANGLSGGRPKAKVYEEKPNSPPENPIKPPAKTQATTQATQPENPSNNPTEGKRREGKGIEPPPAREEGFVLPTEAEVLAWARGHSEPSIGASRVPDEWALDWWDFRMGKPETFPADWQGAAARKFRIDFQNQHPKAHGKKKSAAPDAALASLPELKSL